MDITYLIKYLSDSTLVWANQPFRDQAIKLEQTLYALTGWGAYLKLSGGGVKSKIN